MTKRILAGLTASLLLLSACGPASTPASPSPGGNSPQPTAESPAAESLTPQEGPVSTSEPQEEPAARILCRVVQPYGDSLLLVGQEESSTDVYTLSPQGLADVADLTPGTLVEVGFSGEIMETYPAQFANVTSLTVQEEGFNDLYVLYLSVLEELWETDQALNGDSYIGVDLSQTSLLPAEQSALAWAFAISHDRTPLQGTLEELIEQGYINDGEGGAPYWEDGCLYTIEEISEETDISQGILRFDANKWCSGLGAIWWSDCSSQRDENGSWNEFEVGGFAIS